MNFDELLETHYDLIVAAVRKYAFSSEQADKDDCTQDAMIGLFTATRLFTEGSGASFRTYASIKIRGAILDGIESRSFGHRVRFRESKEYATAQRAITREKGEPATRDEVARALNKSESALPRLDYFQPLEKPNYKDEYGENAMTCQGFASNDCTEHSADVELVNDKIINALVEFPELQQDIFMGYYFRGESMKSLSEHHNITISAACNIRIKIEAHLTKTIGGMQGEKSHDLKQA